MTLNFIALIHSLKDAIFRRAAIELHGTLVYTNRWSQIDKNKTTVVCVVRARQSFDNEVRTTNLCHYPEVTNLIKSDIKLHSIPIPTFIHLLKDTFWYTQTAGVKMTKIRTQWCVRVNRLTMKCGLQICHSNYSVIYLECFLQKSNSAHNLIISTKSKTRIKNKLTQ